MQKVKIEQASSAVSLLWVVIDARVQQKRIEHREKFDNGRETDNIYDPVIL